MLSAGSARSVTAQFSTARNSLYVQNGSTLERTRTTAPSFASLTDIYVSPATGDDENDGTVGAPLASLAEVFARLGDNPIEPSTGNTMTVHILDSITNEECFVDVRAPKNGQHFLVLQGEPTVTLTTTLAAVTPWDVAAGAGVVGTVRGTASLVPHVGSICRIAGGDRDGTIFALRAVESGTDIVFANGAFGLWIPGPMVPEVGDTVEVLSLPTLAESVIFRGDAVVFGAYLQLGGASHSILLESGAQVYLSACKVSGGLDTSGGALLSMVGCYASNPVRSYGGAFVEVYESVVQALTCHTHGEMHVGDTIVDQTCVVGPMGMLSVEDGYFMWFETASAPGPVLRLETAATVDSPGTISGRGITAGGAGRIVLGSRAGLSYATGDPPSIGGAGQQLRIGGTNKDYADLPYTDPTNLATMAPRS